MKDYKKTASEVLRLVGGEGNVAHLEHCSTRLRFSLADPGKADAAALKATSGVMGVIASGPQCQVVIGNDVVEVYDELMKLGKFTAGGAAQAPAAGGKKNISATLLDYMVGIFQALVPAIAGAGILKAMLTVLTTFGIMANDDVVYKVFYYVADAALYYLPIMVAFTTANKLNCNRLVAIATVAAMIFPNTMALLGTEGGAKFFGITLQNVNYTSQVFPAVLTVIFLAFIERSFTKVCPKPVRVFLVPMVCFMVTFPVALLILGPLGYSIGSLLTTVILFLYNTLGWLAVALLSATLPFMIATGMHKAMVPYCVASISNVGYEILYLSASLAHNISEGGACLAVAVRTKDEELRSAAISAGISALFGITEPALYGITLQRKRALYGVCGGSLIAGLFLGIMKVKGFAAMGPGIAGMAMYLDPNYSKNLIYAVAGLVIAVVASFVLTLVFYKEDVPAKAEVSQATPATVPTAGTVNTVNGANTIVYSPIQGKAIPLSEVKDEVFSQGILGEGIAVIPEKGELYAPADGTIENVFDTQHAISMVADTGAELLMHVGMDTVKLGGKGYQAMVKDGDKVKKGRLLLKFDLVTIQAAGYEIATPIVVTNGDDFAVKPVAEGIVVPGAVIMELEART
ncbi:beta-glucoside-specific PTS transporter subunit IIABC [Enterocloster clostridioformis]|uniref:beta-glucoside-specific PTS transporter subunit IIABC n=1 Tax=Enterocloster clostridioformis TaxID=1531 RepID=UPI002674FE15|nr:beta-glucoside-specific PTS transporter subunit IIABC [Enterocloster clostridioformis]